MTVVVAGHLCVDLTPEFDGAEPGMDPGVLYRVGPLRHRIGGSVANTGGALHALGVPVRAFATVGDDELSMVCREQLIQRVGADARLTTSSQGTSYSIVIEHPTHDRTFWNHEGACAEFDPARVELAADAEAVHVGYPSLLPGVCLDPDPLRRLFARARAASITTSLDLAHVAAGSVASRVDWQGWFAAVVAEVDVWSPSWDDMTSALGVNASPTPQAMEAMAERMLGWGAAVVSLSAGQRGFLIMTASADRLVRGGALLEPLATQWAEKSLWFHAEPIASPRTTVGAGDTLTAGLIDALRRGMAPQDAGEHARATVGSHLRGVE